MNMGKSPIGTLNPRPQSPTAIDFIRTWYEAYARVLSFVTTAAVAVVVFAAAFVLRDTLRNGGEESLALIDLRWLLVAWLFLLLGALAGVLARLYSYRWFVAALVDYAHLELKSYGADKFNFGDPSQMRRWWRRSIVWGRLMGLFLGLGAVVLVDGFLVTVWAHWAGIR